MAKCVDCRCELPPRPGLGGCPQLRCAECRRLRNIARVKANYRRRREALGRTVKSYTKRAARVLPLSIPSRAPLPSCGGAMTIPEVARLTKYPEAWLWRLLTYGGTLERVEGSPVRVTAASVDLLRRMYGERPAGVLNAGERRKASRNGQYVAAYQKFETWA